MGKIDGHNSVWVVITCIALSSREASAECQENDPRREQAGMETMEVVCVSCHITPGKRFWGFP